VALYEELFESLFDDKSRAEESARKEEAPEASRERLKGKSKEFLSNPKQADIIRNRLKRAAVEFESDHGNIFAINMCLHAASSIILTNPQNLKATLATIQATDGLKDKDASTVLTVSVLYYLVNIKWDAEESAWPEIYDHLEKLRTGFDAINWLIGEPAMQVLGLIRQAPKKQAA
jgi:hypothetical protein